MIVYSPDLQVRDGMLRLAARVEYEKPAPGMPGRLWFEMPEAQAAYLAPRLDGWAASLFLVAMRRGERLELRGALSDRLAHGIAEYQQAIMGFRPRQVQRVPVCADNYVEPAEPAARAVGLPFSGGVDSYFTLWSHLAPREPSPAFQVTHCVFVEGIDIGYEFEDTMRACREMYRALLAPYGVQLLTLRTNIRDFYPGADWGWMAYAFLAGTGLLFGNLFHRYYLAGTGTYGERLQNDYPLLNHFLSSETLEVETDGGNRIRAQKVAQIAKWEPVRKSLRVCYTVPNGLNNCCRCPKCLHAMACLDLAGELQNIETFPHGYTRALLRGARFAPDVSGIVWTTRQEAARQGRKDLAYDLTVVVGASLVKWSGQRALQAAAARLKRMRGSG